MTRIALLLMSCSFALALTAAHAENAPKTGSDEPMVTIVTATGVSVSITFEGDYGPNRIEGTLVSLPNEPIRAHEGKQTKEIALRHLEELQRIPLGVGTGSLSTYHLQLFTGESYILQPDKSEPPAGVQPASITRTFQIASVPRGAVELKTAMFGVVRIPFPKVLQLTVQPIRGTLHQSTSVMLPVQVLDNLTLMVPFPRITNFRRDPMGGTTTVSFGNAEGATGHVKAMPDGELVIRTPDGEEKHIPLSEIVQYSFDGPITVAADGIQGTKTQKF